MDQPIAKPGILVVDDDALIRDYVAALLLSAGYDVSSAASSRDALDLIEAGLAPDLLFTDLWIGGGTNGLELARRAQLVLPRLKVVFVSGYAGVPGSEALPAGAHFLQKPFRRAQCLDMLHSILTPSTDAG